MAYHQINGLHVHIIFAGDPLAFFFFPPTATAITSLNTSDASIVEFAATIPVTYNSPEAAALEGQLRREGSSWEMAGEGFEEYLQEILEPVYRNIAFNESNEFRIWTPDAMGAFVTGALTAGIMEGGYTAFTGITTSKAGKAVIDANQTNALVEHALTLNTDTEAYSMASKMAEDKVKMTSYNVGELLHAYTRANGDTSFMYTPSVDESAIQNAPIQNGEVTAENRENAAASSETKTEIPAEIQDSIQKSIQTNEKGVEKALITGMSTLIDIEARFKADSGNINHQGLSLDYVLGEYFSYFEGNNALEVPALAIAESIASVMQAESLTAAEKTQLTSVLTEIVGNAGLAKVYVDSKRGAGDNINKGLVDQFNKIVAENGINNLPVSTEQILKFSGGRLDLAERLILATKEVIPGKSVSQLAEIFELPNTPDAASLSIYEARIWYLWQESQIGSRLDYSKPLKQVARDAFYMRNQIRTQAREAMMDRAWAEYLMENDKNKTFEDRVEYYSRKGLTDDALWMEIINASMRSRDKVNDLFGLIKGGY